MHYDFLIEDASGARMLEHLAPKLLSNDDTFHIHAYRGIGRIPKDLKPNADPKLRILLAQLPRLLNGFGETYRGRGDDYPCALIIICDSDTRDPIRFHTELMGILDHCIGPSRLKFCLATEEGEAWLLGDRDAIKSAYPKAKDSVLDAYQQDSVCGTWERLADAIFIGGSNTLKKKSWREIGKEKFEWAQNISPHLVPDRNKSPSFHAFKNAIHSLVEE